MSDPIPDKPTSPNSAFAHRIGLVASRKLRAEKRPEQPLWFGLGTMGLVGWSVSVPTLAGAALGAWLDRTHPNGHSWTLALLIGGLCSGCLTAWYWVEQEADAMNEEQEGGNE